MKERSHRQWLLQVAAGAVWATLGLPLPAPAQQPEIDAPRFAEAVDVRVVNLEVVVADRKGVRVPDLSLEDFRLRVDGRPVPIDYFSAVSDGRTIRASSTVVAPMEDPTQAEDQQTVLPEPGESAGGTAMMLFIDEEHVVKTLRNRVLEEMSERLSSLGEHDRLAIVAWSGKQLVTLCAWTSSRAEIAAAIETASRRKASGIRALAERQRQSRDPLSFGFSSGSSSRALRFERAIGAAISALRIHRRVEGRKAALILTSEWPNGWMQLAPNEIERVGDPADRWAEDVPEWLVQRQGLSRRTIVNSVDNSVEIMKPLIDTANRLGFTLYPISAAGPPSGDNENLAERDGPNGGWFDNASAATGGSLGVVAVTAPRDSRLPELQQLRYLAAATGGRALFYGNRFKALPLVVEDTRSYYSLGFTWNFREDGREHLVDVTTVRKGLKVRTRSSFKDPRRGTDQKLDVLAALISEAPTEAVNASLGVDRSNELELVVGTPRQLERGLLEVPIRLGIPASRVAFLPGPNGSRVSLELRFAAADRKGAQSEIPTIYLRDELPEPPPVLEQTVRLTLRRRPHRIVVSVHDPVGGEVLTGILQLDSRGRSTEAP